MSALWFHTNSGTTWHVDGNTRLEIVNRGGFTKAQICAALVQRGVLDQRGQDVQSTIIAMEGMTVLPQVIPAV